MFKGQLPRSRIIGEPVHVLPELRDGVEGLLVLKGETANLVVDEAGHHLELHGSVSCQVHVLKEIAVCRAIQPSNQCEWGREVKTEMMNVVYYINSAHGQAGSYMTLYNTCTLYEMSYFSRGSK